MRVGLLGFASLLLASSAQAQSFDCRRAGTPDEIAVCRDARLSRLDERLSARFFRLRDSLSGAAQARLERDEDAWLRSRRRCGSDRACIAGAYQARIAQLSGQPFASAVTERTCVRDAKGNQTCAETGR